MGNAHAEIVAPRTMIGESRIGEHHLAGRSPEERAEDEGVLDIVALDVEVFGRTDTQWPASGSRRRPNTDGESNRGTHHQSTEPRRSISAADWQSDTNP